MKTSDPENILNNIYNRVSWNKRTAIWTFLENSRKEWCSTDVVFHACSIISGINSWIIQLPTTFIRPYSVILWRILETIQNNGGKVKINSVLGLTLEDFLNGIEKTKFTVRIDTDSPETLWIDIIT
jgi:hypothetical protein